MHLNEIFRNKLIWFLDPSDPLPLHPCGINLCFKTFKMLQKLPKYSQNLLNAPKMELFCPLPQRNFQVCELWVGFRQIRQSIRKPHFDLFRLKIPPSTSYIQIKAWVLFSYCFVWMASYAIMSTITNNYSKSDNIIIASFTSIVCTCCLRED